MIGATKLLTVGTNPASRRAVAELLRSAGWNVEANDDDPAVFRKKLQGFGQGLDLASFGVAVIDLDAMPSVDKILKELRRKDPHLPILQITARAKDAGGTEMAADALLIRPFEGEELLSLVRMLVRLREARQAADESETWLQLAQEAGGLAVMEMRLLVGQARWSPKFAEIFQLPPDAVDPGLIAQRVHPEDLPRLRKEYEINLQRGEPFERDFRICLPDGCIRWIAMRGKFGRDASGRAERILFLTSDITARKEAELQNAQLAAIVSSSIDAIVSVDFADRIRTWNRGAEQLFGYQAAEVLGGPASFLVPSDLLEERAILMQRLASGETIEYHTLRRRKDGQVLNVWIRGAPVRSVNGALAGGSLIIRDVTAQHRHEEHVRFLMRELTHRSKNLLAVIQAMARQTLSHQTSPEDFVARFSERLSGLAGSHDLLSSDDWAGASLVQLIRSQLQHYGDLFGERIFLEGPDLFLRPEAAQNIGIALHELSTNAAKFGSLSVPEGKVTISWSFVLNEQGERRLHLIWAERGGPSVIVPDHKGFGHMVMHRITGPALGGQSHMQFESGGVTWHLDVPVADVIRHKDENDRPRDTEAP
jgi:PAS domain S-box-containing protein